MEINDRKIRIRLIDIKRTIESLDSGEGTLLERTNKDLIIAGLRKEEKILNWVLKD